MVANFQPVQVPAFHQALLSRLNTIGDMGQVQQLPTPQQSPMAQYGGPGGTISYGAGDLRPGKGVGRDPISFGRWLQSQGFRVSENPNFGGVEPVHVKNSDHYRGHAYDVNWAAGTSRRETEMINRILNAARAWGLRYIWQKPGHYNHIHFDW